MDQRSTRPTTRAPMRCIYCSISAAVFSLGALLLVAGVVLYILFERDHRAHHLPTQLVVIIVVCSLGLAFILFSLIFAILACVARHPEPERHGVRRPDQEQPLIHSSKMPVPDSSPKRLPSESSDRDWSHPMQGDINTVGLPPAHSARHWVPPNGFSYLAHPSEIQSYHESRHPTGRGGLYTSVGPRKESAI